MLFALHLPNLQTRILYTFVQLCSVIELGHRKKFLVKNSWDYWGYVSTVRVCYVMQIKTAHIFQIKKICNFRSPFFYAVNEMYRFCFYLYTLHMNLVFPPPPLPLLYARSRWWTSSSVQDVFLHKKRHEVSSIHDLDPQKSLRSLARGQHAPPRFLNSSTCGIFPFICASPLWQWLARTVYQFPDFFRQFMRHCRAQKLADFLWY